MKRFLIPFLCFLAALVACQKVVETELSVTPSSLSFASDGGEQKITLSANKAWSVRADQSWCKVMPGSGTSITGEVLSVVCQANTDYDERSCTVTVICEEKQVGITVKQAGVNGLIVSPATLTLSAEAQLAEVEISHNVDVDVVIPAECQDWIALSGTKGLSKTVYVLSISQNILPKAREGAVTFRQVGGELSGTVRIAQEAASTPPENQIWYTSADGSVVTPKANADFGAALLSNTYEDGLGVITFDEPVTTIGYDAFDGTDLSSIIFPESLASIGNYAFLYCHKLESAVLPGSLASIGVGAFEGCDLLVSMHIPESVSEIGNSAFCMCPALREFSGKYASADQRLLVLDGKVVAFAPAGLSEYTMAAGVTVIGRASFGYCKELTALTLPSGVNSIEEFAFSDCWNLVSVGMPDTIRRIEDYVFYDCISLETIHIPEQVEDIGLTPFAGCTAMREFTGKYASADHRLLVNNGVIFAFAPFGLSQYMIPEGIANVISSGVFENCSQLTSVSIPNGMEIIGWGAFRSSGLYAVTIPSSVRYLEDWAFAYCRDMVSITFLSSVPPQGASHMFDDTTCTIYVPEDAVEAYRTAPYWSDYADRIAPGAGIVEEEYVAVDLGLSVKWASKNVGAFNKSDSGNYYAWGEVTTRDKWSYDEYNYQWGTDWTHMTKYVTNEEYGEVDNLARLLPEDDAARVIMGGNWRMPTYVEFEELLYFCSYFETQVNDVTGMQFTGPSGNSIFIPFVGMVDRGEGNGYLWSSDLHGSYSPLAYYLQIVSKENEYGDTPGPKTGSCHRSAGLPIRAVWDAN